MSKTAKKPEKVATVVGDVRKLSVPVGKWEGDGPLKDYHGERMRRRRIHIDLQLTEEQSDTLRSLFVGLYESHAHLANGLSVNGATDVVRFLLDKAAANGGQAEPVATSGAPARP